MYRQYRSNSEGFTSRPLPSDVGQAPALESGVLPSERDLDQTTSDDVQATCTTPEPHTVCDTDSCDCSGCSIGMESPTPFQTKQVAILSNFQRSKQTFLASWYEAFKWLTLCVKRYKVFCVYCRYANARRLITFAKHGNTAFSSILALIITKML